MISYHINCMFFCGVYFVIGNNDSYKIDIMLNFFYKKLYYIFAHMHKIVLSKVV
jgi:hypothetical protein